MTQYSWRKMLKDRAKEPVTWGEFLYVISVGLTIQIIKAMLD